jgi:hypothetical protein
MKIKWTIRVLIGFMSSLLAQYTAYAIAFGSGSQFDDQSPAPTVQLSPQELQQLVAPIALYPDALVAQVLAASTFPAEIVVADRWLHDNSDLKGERLAEGVDRQPWDPSVKALTQFPSVLENMDKNLSWTSSLGDAYANQQEEVMAAIQRMRQQAQKAGHLNSNDQEEVTTQDETIVIQPADPDVVYVPAYDPWLVYGYPIVPYPGWYHEPGLFFDGAGLFFGAGFGIGFYGGFAWGWNRWGWDWRGHAMIYNHNAYISHSPTIVSRNNFDGRSNFNPGDAFRGSNSGDRNQEFHGSSNFQGEPGIRSGALSGFDHGGNVQAFSFRGQSSFGGGFHGGGGGHR